MSVSELMPKDPKLSGVTMIVSAILTLAILSVLALFEPSAMLVVAGVGFVFLALRFVWLVWRELK